MNECTCQYTESHYAAAWHDEDCPRYQNQCTRCEGEGDERLAELADMSQNVADVLVSRNLQVGAYPDIAAALRELQQLRRQHREIICTRCLLREQLAKESPLPEPDPLF